jgi:hypothetical protein
MDIEQAKRFLNGNIRYFKKVYLVYKIENDLMYCRAPELANYNSIIIQISKVPLFEITQL